MIVEKGVVVVFIFLFVIGFLILLKFFVLGIIVLIFFGLVEVIVYLIILFVEFDVSFNKVLFVLFGGGFLLEMDKGVV